MRAMAARPFIVFTTQRSGSGWTMDLLGTQEGIRTPGISKLDGTESMLPTHKANKEHWHAFKWEAWRDEAERAFANVVASNPAARAVGWKLMYDQVPQLDRQIVGYHALRDSHGGCYTVRDAGPLTPGYKCAVYAYQTRIRMEMVRRPRKTHRGSIYLSGASSADRAVCGVGAQQQHPGRAPCARGVAAEALVE